MGKATWIPSCTVALGHFLNSEKRGTISKPLELGSTLTSFSSALVIEVQLLNRTQQVQLLLCAALPCSNFVSMCHTNPNLYQ